MRPKSKSHPGPPRPVRRRPEGRVEEDTLAAGAEAAALPPGSDSRYNRRVQACFVLGPAGSGKTFRCLTEIRAALRAEPDGPPLILLAPKQATFQLERQLLADPALPGYTRLYILSFERLAGFVLAATGVPVPDLLSAEGRVMVLRALLARHGESLRVFHATARLTGFAQQLSAQLRELQEHQLAPARLESLAPRAPAADRLGDKLRDLARLLSAYKAWLTAHHLEDSNRLLEFATRALKLNPTAVSLGGLWLDGFAEMTPQELDLLAALVPSAPRATLAFCLPEAAADAGSWLSPWFVNARTAAALRARLAALPTVAIASERLPRPTQPTRFDTQPALRHLEAAWSAPTPFQGPAPTALRLAGCRDVEAETILAAREIRQFVRAGGRYREAALLVRSLDAYHDTVRRVFRRYDLPCFIDRRESVGHHPLAELTRLAVRTVAFNWRHDDWFGVLKTGLAPAREDELDALENEALARGWQGELWFGPLESAAPGETPGRWDRLRERLLPPFLELRDGLHAAGGCPTGRSFAAAIRELWRRLGVARRLEEWSAAAADPIGALPAQAHATVWEQTQDLLDNLERAFSTDRMPVTDWLPVLEAGLATLSVGVIPPALDQVLVGAVDRSRNPDLRLLIVMGLNDGVFPAIPPAPALLTDGDRTALGELGVELGLDRRRQLGRERYLGYIACTRGRERLVVTWAARNQQDRPLSPSPLVGHLQALFPDQPVESPADPLFTNPPEHPVDLLAPALQGDPVAEAACEQLAPAPWLALKPLRGVARDQCLSPSVAAVLHGTDVLRTSVSRIEQFAACPFRFFISAGLRAQERDCFEVDARRRGSFQHEVLARFHHELRKEGLRWRDLTPDLAAGRIRRLGLEVAHAYGEGLFEADDRSVFTAQSLTRALEAFIREVVRWNRASYDFDPIEVELAFGLPEAALPPWRLELGDGRRLELTGKVDRLDLAPATAGQPAWCVVLDYKSSARAVDPLLLEHGIQLQLPAYLAAVTRPAADAPTPWRTPLRPAGFFYASWQPRAERSDNRRATGADDPAAAARLYQHRGRFSLEALPRLERQPASGQFACRRRQDGEPVSGQSDPLSAADFDRLLDRVADRLRELGSAILDGRAAVDPYQKSASQRACTTCEYQAICRIDPWTHPFRRLERSRETAEE